MHVYHISPIDYYNIQDTKHNFDERLRGGGTRRQASEPVYFGVSNLSGQDELFETVTEANYREAAKTQGTRVRPSSSRRSRTLPVYLTGRKRASHGCTSTGARSSAFKSANDNAILDRENAAGVALESCLHVESPHTIPHALNWDLYTLRVQHSLALESSLEDGARSLDSSIAQSNLQWPIYNTDNGLNGSIGLFPSNTGYSSIYQNPYTSGPPLDTFAFVSPSSDSSTIQTNYSQLPDPSTYLSQPIYSGGETDPSQWTGGAAPYEAYGTWSSPISLSDSPVSQNFGQSPLLVDGAAYLTLPSHESHCIYDSHWTHGSYGGH